MKTTIKTLQNYLENKKELTDLHAVDFEELNSLIFLSDEIKKLGKSQGISF